MSGVRHRAASGLAEYGSRTGRPIDALAGDRMHVLTALMLALTAPLSSAWAAEAKNFTLMSIDNQQVSLADHADKVVLMSFWATWCGPCKEEMPHLQKLYDAHKDAGFVVLSISTDDARSASRVKPWIMSNQYTFPVLLDKESKVIAQYNPSKTLPFTVVVHKGQVVKTHSGYNPGDEKLLAEFVEGLLAPGAPAGTTDGPPAAPVPPVEPGK
jgi:peroxiredoxin